MEFNLLIKLHLIAGILYITAAGLLYTDGYTFKYYMAEMETYPSSRWINYRGFRIGYSLFLCTPIYYFLMKYAKKHPAYLEDKNKKSQSLNSYSEI